MRIRADLQSEDPDRQLTGLVLIRKLLSSTGRTKHMQVFRGVLANECVFGYNPNPSPSPSPNPTPNPDPNPNPNPNPLTKP